MDHLQSSPHNKNLSPLTPVCYRFKANETGVSSQNIWLRCGDRALWLSHPSHGHRSVTLCMNCTHRFNKQQNMPFLLWKYNTMFSLGTTKPSQKTEHCLVLTAGRKRLQKGHQPVAPMSLFSKASFSCSSGPDKSNFFGSLLCSNYSSSSFWKKVSALFLNNPEVSMEDRLILRQGSSLFAFLLAPTKAPFPSSAYHERDQYS